MVCQVGLPVKPTCLDRPFTYLVDRSHFEFIFMWNFDVNNHVSVPTLSTTLFFKKFDRDQSVANRNSKYTVEKWIACGVN